jgi:hypothetical protein
MTLGGFGTVLAEPRRSIVGVGLSNAERREQLWRIRRYGAKLVAPALL